MTAKQHLRTLIKKLPDNCTVEDVMCELYVIQKVEPSEPVAVLLILRRAKKRAHQPIDSRIGTGN